MAQKREEKGREKSGATAPKNPSGGLGQFLDAGIADVANEFA